jgi:aryl-alcohol dehydrogenase-like predicted oxidoreductase
MKALHDLVTSGKVRYIGASSMWTWEFAHYNHVAEKVIAISTSVWVLSRLFPRTAGRNLFLCKTTILLCKQTSLLFSLELIAQLDCSYREEEREMIKYCNFAGVGLIPWGPLNGGFLARPVDYDKASERTARDKNDDNMPWQNPRDKWEIEIANRVRKVAADKGWKMSQVALTWINEKVSSPIVGFSSVCAQAMMLSCCSTTDLAIDLAPRGSPYIRVQTH